MEDYEMIKNYIQTTLESLQLSYAERKIQNGVQDNPEDEMKDQMYEIMVLENQIKTLGELASNFFLKQLKKDLILESSQKQINEKDHNIDQMQYSLQSQSQEILYLQTQINQYTILLRECQEKTEEHAFQNSELEDQISNTKRQKDAAEQQVYALSTQKKDNQKLKTIQDNHKDLLVVHEELQKELKEFKDINKDLDDNIVQLQKLLNKESQISTSLQQKIKTVQDKKQELEERVIQLQDLLIEYKRDNDSLVSQIQNISTQTLIEDTETRKSSHSLEEIYENTIQEEEETIQSPIQLQEDILNQTKDDESLFSQIQNIPSVPENILLKVKNKKKAPTLADFKFFNIIQEDEEQAPIQIQTRTTKHQRNCKTQYFPSPKKQVILDRISEMNWFIKQKANTKISIEITEVKKDSEQLHKIKVDKKKEPLYQFFDLTAQTVKLNSPLMDDILCINTNGWYDDALKEDIPYHRWYVWIDKRIHHELRSIE